MTPKGKIPPQAMAFYHQDGLTAAWKHAKLFAGKMGRIATMPDIVEARLKSKPGEIPWETYFTTLSAEYLGLSRQGNKILIVAHGVGPMSTLDGIIKAYGWQFKDMERNRKGGRITQQEFWDLEDGKFGEVSIIDFDSYCQKRKYPFVDVLTVLQAQNDPVVQARFGPQAEEYVKANAEYARVWHREQASVIPENKCGRSDVAHSTFVDRRRRLHKTYAHLDSNPFILQLGPSSYPYWKMDDGFAIGHLLSVGRLCHLHHEGNESLTHDVSIHGWNDGTRLVGIKPDGSILSGLHIGPNAQDLLRKHWRNLFLPVKNPTSVGFRALVNIGEQWFTQYPKKGEVMDTWEPEHMVTSVKEVGSPVVFKTTIGGYHGFFMYGTNEVKAIAPPDANAYYLVGEPEIVWDNGNPTHHTCEVQFYRIEADSSKRLMRPDVLARDFDTMMKLVSK